MPENEADTQTRKKRNMLMIKQFVRNRIRLSGLAAAYSPMRLICGVLHTVPGRIPKLELPDQERLLEGPRMSYKLCQSLRQPLVPAIYWTGHGAGGMIVPCSSMERSDEIALK